jgi:hypothetical protein
MSKNRYYTNNDDYEVMVDMNEHNLVLNGTCVSFEFLHYMIEAAKQSNGATFRFNMEEGDTENLYYTELFTTK